MNFDQLSVQIPYTDVIIKYGAFITSVINFLIMALIIFLIVKVINKIMTFGRKKEEQTQEETTKECPYCKSEISIEATRCPHCTSKLEGYNGQD